MVMVVVMVVDATGAAAIARVASVVGRRFLLSLGMYVGCRCCQRRSCGSCLAVVGDKTIPQYIFAPVATMLVVSTVFAPTLVQPRQHEILRSRLLPVPVQN